MDSDVVWSRIVMPLRSVAGRSTHSRATATPAIVRLSGTTVASRRRTHQFVSSISHTSLAPHPSSHSPATQHHPTPTHTATHPTATHLEIETRIECISFAEIRLSTGECVSRQDPQEAVVRPPERPDSELERLDHASIVGRPERHRRGNPRSDNRSE